MHDLGQKMKTSDLCYCSLTFRKPSELTLTDPILILAQLAVLGLLEVLRANTCLIFTHLVFSASLYLSTSINAIDPVCFKQFSNEGDVDPFRDDISHKYLMKIS